MNITKFSTTCIQTDRFADYIPIVSTITNIVNLFLKCVVLPNMSKEEIAKSHYFTYLNAKNTGHCIIALVPIIGNLYIQSMNSKAERLMLGLKKSPDPAYCLMACQEAASLGSSEAWLGLGELYQIGIGLPEGQKSSRDMRTEASREAFRTAAALGNKEALKKINEEAPEITTLDKFGFALASALSFFS